MIDYSQNIGDNVNKYYYTINFIRLSLIIINGFELVYKKNCVIFNIII